MNINILYSVLLVLVVVAVQYNGKTDFKKRTDRSDSLDRSDCLLLSPQDLLLSTRNGIHMTGSLAQMIHGIFFRLVGKLDSIT